MFSNILENKTLVNLVLLVVIAPLLWAIGTEKLNAKYATWLAIATAVLAIYQLFLKNMFEGMEVCGSTVHNIRMFDSQPGYDKPCLTIKSGDIVSWTNVGEIQHGVRDINGLFDSGMLYPGQSYSIRLDAPGVYEYYCNLRSGYMIGHIKVE